MMKVDLILHILIFQSWYYFVGFQIKALLRFFNLLNVSKAILRYVWGIIGKIIIMSKRTSWISTFLLAVIGIWPLNVHCCISSKAKRYKIKLPYHQLIIFSSNNTLLISRWYCLFIFIFFKPRELIFLFKKIIDNSIYKFCIKLINFFWNLELFPQP